MGIDSSFRLPLGARDGRDGWDLRGRSVSGSLGRGESGVKGTFGVLSLLLGRLSLFFGVGHFVKLVYMFSFW